MRIRVFMFGCKQYNRGFLLDRVGIFGLILQTVFVVHQNSAEHWNEMIEYRARGRRKANSLLIWKTREITEKPRIITNQLQDNTSKTCQIYIPIVR